MTAQKIIQEMDKTLFANISHLVGSTLEKVPLLSDMSRSYRIEPPAMTVKHILQEGPNSREIFGFAPMKFFVKGIIQYIAQHTSLKYLEDNLDNDSTYFGSFVGDFTKVLQSGTGYALGWDYGTQKYEWYRPTGDVIKGVCKLS